MATVSPKLAIEVPHEEIADFCRKWKVSELSLFGSVLRDDFGPDSDLDVLVAFEDSAPWSLWDWSAMLDDLRSIFHRDVDLVEKKALRNPFRRHAILSTRHVIYPA